MTINDDFRSLTGFTPLSWQRRLYLEHFARGDIPRAVDVPTGLGKTSVIALWLIARARGVPLPRRLVYVVDRRAVVDQATDEAEKLRKALDGKAAHFGNLDAGEQAKQIAAQLKKLLGFDDKRALPISTLRGAHVDNREWLDDPAAPAIIVGTVDMTGSRLLFGGYGVSRKMRPYQAGLLGVDTLVVLDEAHLVPPFAHLLRAIETDAKLWPASEADCAFLPRFAVLPLSATQRDSGESNESRKAFHLLPVDWETDDIVKERVNAGKRLLLKPLAEKDQDKQLAEAAWSLATKGGKFSRIAVFCDRRDKKEDGGGPSAQGVKDELEKRAKGDRKADRPKVDIHPVELLVGARRVREREGVAKRLRELGFIGERKPLDKPAFLIATSAGEVGVDIDADHMVCDLAAWERMVQRLGRVNRRGKGVAEIVAFWSEPKLKVEKEPTEHEKRALTAFASKAVLERLPQIGGAFDASPGALRTLAERVRSDAALKVLVDAATTPEPLRPALNRALVDAWSMTSLVEHTGRPGVQPWLRGWVDEPQTAIVWRQYLPLRINERGRAAFSSKKEIEDFFEAAPPHESEKLETETFRVIEWLETRARALMGKRSGQTAKEAEVDDTEDDQPAEDGQAESPETDGAILDQPAIDASSIVAITLSASGDLDRAYRLRDFARKRDSNARKSFEAGFYGRTLVVDARLGGLKDGLLSSNDDVLETADAVDEWSRQAGFRVRRAARLDDEITEDEWRFEDDFVLRLDAEGTPLEWFVVEHFKNTAQGEESRSVSKPQELSKHQERARSEMIRIAKGVGLHDAAVNALAIGASLHDEGKKAPRWQRAFKAPRDAKRCGLAGPLAKTRGPIDQSILDGYRHEFGSLPHVEAHAEFKALPDDWRDLILHLVAAHHGRARPAIETRGGENPPELLEESARGVALRFARLQKRWGPWGLAWWEGLLRAADQRASRDNEEHS